VIRLDVPLAFLIAAIGMFVVLRWATTKRVPWLSIFVLVVVSAFIFTPMTFLDPIFRGWTRIVLVRQQFEMTSMLKDLRPGLSRDEAYARIKAHWQVAYNQNYGRWGSGSFEGMVVDGSDAWPSPGQSMLPHNDYDVPPISIRHPYVYVAFEGSEGLPICLSASRLKISFDDHDKISRIVIIPSQVHC
jgi:hypothetical protein